MSGVLGLIAALLAPAVMTVGVYIWGETWTGSAIFLNAWKGIFAGAIFCVVIAVHAAGLQETIIPAELGGETIGWLLLSSFLGIVIGDTFWLMALARIGALRCILIDSIKPFLAAILAYLLLDEHFSGRILIGMAITTAGILLVATDKATKSQSKPGSETAEVIQHKSCEQASDTSLECSYGKEGSCPDKEIQLEEKRHASGTEAQDHTSKVPARTTNSQSRTCQSLAPGYAFAALNCAFDVLASVITKAHAKHLTTLHINFVRFGGAGVQLFLLIGAARYMAKGAGRTPANWCAAARLSWRGWCIMCIGTLLATVVCPALSQVALFRIDLSIYTTLISMGPIWSLPVGMIAKRERPSLRAVAGSLLAAGGIVPLALSIQG